MSASVGCRSETIWARLQLVSRLCSAETGVKRRDVPSRRILRDFKEYNIFVYLKIDLVDTYSSWYGT